MMSVFILFYLWIVPIVIGILCSVAAHKSKGKMRVAPGIAMIVLSIISLITAFTAGHTNFHVFIGGMFYSAPSWSVLLFLSSSAEEKRKITYYEKSSVRFDKNKHARTNASSFETRCICPFVCFEYGEISS